MFLHEDKRKTTALIVIIVMLMNRTLARVTLEPAHDAVVVEAAEALQAAHIDGDFELLEADGALGRVDTVLLRGLVREDAGAARQARGRAADGLGLGLRGGGCGYAARGGGVEGGRREGGGGRGALRGRWDWWAGGGASHGGLDALVDMGLPQGFDSSLAFRARRQSVMADGAEVCVVVLPGVSVGVERWVLWRVVESTPRAVYAIIIRSLMESWTCTDDGRWPTCRRLVGGVASSLTMLLW